MEEQQTVKSGTREFVVKYFQGARVKVALADGKSSALMGSLGLRRLADDLDALNAE